MARRRRRGRRVDAASEAVERERRERLRRERERQRRSAPARRTPPRRTTPAASSASAVPGASAVRERHEGLVGWIARMLVQAPAAIAQLPAGLARAMRRFALEVVAVVAGIGRALVSVIPGASVLGRSRAAVATTTRGARMPRSRRGSVDAAPRTPAQLRAAAERRAQLRRSLRLLGIVSVLAALAAAWVFVPRSQLFDIRHVEVSGASAVDDLDVRTQVDELLAGETVFTLDTDAVAARIEELPFVREARVERHLPGGIELQVTEYRPLALAYGDGRFWLVAHDGRILSRVKGSEWKGRIPLVWLQGEDLQPGTRVDEEPALQLLRARAADSPLDFGLIRVEDYRIEAELDDGVLVRFGRPVQLRLKLAAAQRTIELLRRDGKSLLYVDVSVPGKPAYCLDNVAACHQPRGEQQDEDAAATTDADAGPTTPEEVGGDEATDAEATG